MTEELANRFAILVEFLGGVLGSDYEIALYDLDTEGYPVIAIANGRVSGQTIGNPLPESIRERLHQGEYRKSDYIVNFTSFLCGSKKKIRSSVMLIKDEDGKPCGMLGINFDDSRFLELSRHMIDLIHPHGYLRQQLSPMDTFRSLASDIENCSEGGTAHNDIMEMAAEIFSNAANSLFAAPDRLTQEERISFVAKLRDMGMFRLKGGLQYTAEKLGCSQASIYRYLEKTKAVVTDQNQV